jgi:hypothetical protein
MRTREEIERSNLQLENGAVGGAVCTYADKTKQLNHHENEQVKKRGGQ